MFIFRWLGIVTQKEIKMLRDDFNAKLVALAGKVDVLSNDFDAAVAAAQSNSLVQADLDALDVVSAKVDAMEAKVAPPAAPSV